MSAEQPQVPSSVADGQDGDRFRGQVGSAVSDLANAYSARVAGEIERCGLSSHEFAVLEPFWEQHEWTVSQLASRLQVDISRMSRRVLKLVDRKMLRRRRAATDRRVIHLTVTPQGRDLIEELRKRLAALEAELLKGVTMAEIDGLLATVDKIVDNSADAQHASPD